MSLNLTNTPEIESLKEKYLLLKGEYVKLLTDKDSMQQWSEPQLEALYVVKVGHKQLQLLEIQLEMAIWKAFALYLSWRRIWNLLLKSYPPKIFNCKLSC